MSGKKVDITGTDPSSSNMPSDPNQKWLTRIKAGIKFRDRTRATASWDRFAQYYIHEHQKDPNVVMPTFNMIYMFGRSLMPSIIYQNPQVINTARRPEFIPWASAMDSLDNWLIEEMELDEVFKLAVLFGYLFNIGPVMTCFDFLGKDMPEGKSVLNDAITNLTGFNKLTGVTNRSRRHNFPWLDLIDPKKFIVAPNTRNMRNCPWFVKTVCYSTEALRKYLGDKSIQSTHIPDESQYLQETFKGYEDPDNEYTVVHEIHDARDGKWQMLDCEGRTVLPPEDDELQVDGLPIDAVIFNQAPFSIWGTPDPTYIEGQMLDGDDSRIMGWKQRRISLLKGIVNEEMMSKEEQEKFFTDDAGAFLRVRPPGSKALSESMMLVQPHLHQELYAYNEKGMEDAQRILGFGPNQLGTFAPGRRTRYEVQIVEDRNQARGSERREMVAQCIAGVMRKINLLIIRNWKKPIIQRVIGMDLAQHWVEIKPGEFSEANLRDEVRTTVDVASMTPISNDRLKQEMLEVLDLVIKVPGANALPIVKQLLSKFPWINTQEVLPQANPGAPISMGQFQDEQKKLMGDPARMAAAQKQNVQALPALLAGSKAPRRK